MYPSHNIRSLATIVIGVLTVSSMSTVPYQCAKSLCRYRSPAASSDSVWGHWKEVENLIVFGASYAATGPDIYNPTPPYKTSCNGPNYIDSLSNGCNQSVIKTTQYAVPGSPVSKEILGITDPKASSFLDQVNLYLKDVKAGQLKGSVAANTLYHTEFGINDINTAGSKYASLETTIFEKYASIFDTLYHSGARNFLIVDVPPIDRSPAATDQNLSKLWKKQVTSFNTRLSSMLKILVTKYTDAVFFQVAINSLFSSVLDNPSSSSFTEVYKTTTQDCPAYISAGGPNAGNLPSENYTSPACPYAVNQYFWLQGYHPTYPMHDLMASDIAGGLEVL